jgi:RNA-directed DNA polymerase
MAETPNSVDVFTQRQRIAELAQRHPDMSFTSLNHLLQLSTLELAHARTRKSGAVGVDGTTAADYEADLQGNLQSLLARAHAGTYVAPPVRRVRIPKEGKPGETRPIGIPTFEDKVLQRAVVWILEAIYERDFYDCSYGFRPGRSAHQALDALRKGAMRLGGGWVLEVDIRKFFDTLDHGVLRDLLSRRVRDGVLRRLIGKWLNAGVLEDGALTRPQSGSPQGGVVSPTLANVYLHYVLDEWFHTVVKPRMRGACFLIRYADDFVIVFSDETDARRVMKVMPKRFARFGLSVHPEKTRLVAFRRPDPSGRSAPPGTFDLLGFTHYWAKSRKGRWVIQRKTARSRLRRAITTIAAWCRRNRHLPVDEQHRTLQQKLQGHYAYYGVTGNSRSLWRCYVETQHNWRKWLSRRSQKSYLDWERYRALLKRLPLPPPRVVRSVYLAHAKL